MTATFVSFCFLLSYLQLFPPDDSFCIRFVQKMAQCHRAGAAGVVRVTSVPGYERINAERPQIRGCGNSWNKSIPVMCKRTSGDFEGMLELIGRERRKRETTTKEERWSPYFGNNGLKAKHGTSRAHRKMEERYEDEGRLLSRTPTAQLKHHRYRHVQVEVFRRRPHRYRAPFCHSSAITPADPWSRRA